MFDSPGFVTSMESPQRPRYPSIHVSIGKLDNGYMVTLTEVPKPPPPRKPRPIPPGPFVGMDPDEIIDQMIDGAGAVIRAINDKGAGEHWKDDEDRQKIREAFKVMFPGMAQHAIEVTEEPGAPFEYIQPRNEQLVFESKDEMIEYLKKNL